jgi:hypothetical protein
MSNCSKSTRCDGGAVRGFLAATLRWLPAWIALVLVTAALPARALEPDAWYLQIYGSIERADELHTSGQAEKAKAKYVEAEKALKNFKQNFPNYNPKVIAARQSYLAGKIAALSQPPPIAPGAETAENKPTPAALGTALAGHPKVKLLEPGAEPREVYRLRAQPLALQKITQIAKINLSLSLPETPGEPMKVPPVSVKSVVIPKRIAAEGDVDFEILIEAVEVVAEPGVAAVMLDTLKQSVAGLKGLVLAGTMTDRYIIKKLEARIPPGTDAQTREGMVEMKRAFMSSAYVLPEEAIGVGAQWEVKEKTKQQGMTIDQTTRIEVVAVENGALRLNIATTQSAANQKIANPIMPALKVDLTKMTGTGTGTATVELAKLFASKVTTDEHSELNMSMNSGGKKQIMTMKTETRVTWESN